MSRTPSVSIGLPIRNGERFLAATLESILGQTFEDFELILSDNASSDSTADICVAYAKRDKRVKYNRNTTNLGLTQNFNRAFELSSGKYFRWSSADDLFAPTSIAVCLEVLSNHPEVALCYPKTILIDSDGKTIREYEDNLDLRLSRAVDRFRVTLRNIGLVNAHYGLIRADVLRRTSLFGSYPGSDMVLLAELALYGQFWEIPQPLFFRRMHDRASSALRTASWDAVQEFWNPATKGGLNFYYWTHRYHNLTSVIRAPIGVIEKIQAALILADYALRSRNVYIQELQSASWHFVKRMTTEGGK